MVKFKDHLVPLVDRTMKRLKQAREMVSYNIIMILSDQLLLTKMSVLVRVVLLRSWIRNCHRESEWLFSDLITAIA